nr:unnamed protein product [Callosobruchus analis]
MMFVLSWVFTAAIASVVNAQSVIDADPGVAPENEPLVNSAVTLRCHRVPYTYRVQQADDNGKQCWDVISVMACWGRCDSNEISDWRFPFKRSNHPVCVHYGRNRVLTKLRHCEEGAKEGTELYEYLEADQCKCQLCSSSDTSCEGLRYKHGTESLGFTINF